MEEEYNIYKKCPKCKSKNFDVIEYYIACIYYSWENEEFTDSGSDYEKNLYYQGYCNICKHKWNFKNVNYITDIVELKTSYNNDYTNNEK